MRGPAIGFARGTADQQNRTDGQKRKEKRDGTFSSISATASDKIGTQEMAEREKETGHKKKGTAFFVVGMRLALM